MGRDDLHYLRYFRQKYLQGKAPLVVGSFGAGGGHLERTLIEMEFPCEAIDGFELNPRLVAAANEKALAMGAPHLRYFEADLNRPRLPEAKYDLGIFFHSLHHVAKVEECLKTVKRSLKSEGLLLVVDFIGPNRHQWSDHQILLAEHILGLLPPRYRVQGPSGSVKDNARRPTVDEVIQADPSEAVRSEDVLRCLRAEFGELELKSLGGSVLNHVFDGIAQNFDEQTEQDRRIIRILQDLEEWLESNGFVAPDFLFGVYEA